MSKRVGSDIAERLRAAVRGFGGYAATHHGIGSELMTAAIEAADEIERLRAAVGSDRAHFPSDKLTALHAVAPAATTED